MDIALALIGAAWLAIGLMLLWGALRLVWTRPPVPFFAMLEREGLSLGQVERAVGLEALGRAVGRCSDCNLRWNCGQRAADCPNAPIFLRAKGLA